MVYPKYRESQVVISKFNVFRSLKIAFVLANSEYNDKEQHYAAVSPGSSMFANDARI